MLQQTLKETRVSYHVYGATPPPHVVTISLHPPTHIQSELAAELRVQHRELTLTATSSSSSLMSAPGVSRASVPRLVGRSCGALGRLSPGPHQAHVRFCCVAGSAAQLFSHRAAGVPQVPAVWLTSVVRCSRTTCSKRTR